MTWVRCVAALAVLVPVLAAMWVLGCVLQLGATVSRMLTRWATGTSREEEERHA